MNTCNISASLSHGNIYERLSGADDFAIISRGFGRNGETQIGKMMTAPSLATSEYVAYDLLDDGAMVPLRLPLGSFGLNRKGDADDDQKTSNKCIIAYIRWVQS